MKTEGSEILRFATFEVNLRAGELRKQGVRIKLQEQPFHVLKILLERPGEVVTREELRAAIWQSDTFVDFDNGLNTSINKLREALGDSADSPRFVETLPRRGYRFIAPITGVDGTTRGTGAGVSPVTANAVGRSSGQWRLLCLQRESLEGCSGARGKRGGLRKKTLSFSEILPTRLAMRYSTGRFEKAFPSSYTSPLPEPRVRGRNPSNVADDGTPGKYATHAGNHARSLSTDEQRSSTRRFDRTDRRPLYSDSQGGELC